MQNKQNRGKGFTLVEILIVVVILGILAAIVVPQFAGAANEARTGNVLTQTQTIETQLELYAARNNGIYPDLGTGDAAGWGTVGDALTPETMIGGGYLKSMPVNPHATAPGTGVAANAAFVDPPTASALAEAFWTGAAIPNAAAWQYNRANGIIRAAGANYIPRNNAGIGDNG